MRSEAEVGLAARTEEAVAEPQPSRAHAFPPSTADSLFPLAGSPVNVPPSEARPAGLRVQCSAVSASRRRFEAISRLRLERLRILAKYVSLIQRRFRARLEARRLREETARRRAAISVSQRRLQRISVLRLANHKRRAKAISRVQTRVREKRRERLAKDAAAISHAQDARISG